MELEQAKAKAKERLAWVTEHPGYEGEGDKVVKALMDEVERLTGVLQGIARQNVAERSIAGAMRRKALEAVGAPRSICHSCGKADVSCPIYPQETQACVEYVEAVRRP